MPLKDSLSNKAESITNSSNNILAEELLLRLSITSLTTLLLYIMPAYEALLIKFNGMFEPIDLK